MLLHIQHYGYIVYILVLEQHLVDTITFIFTFCSSNLSWKHHEENIEETFRSSKTKMFLSLSTFYLINGQNHLTQKIGDIYCTKRFLRAQQASDCT